MQPGALLARLGTALSPTTHRCLAGCGKPLAVLAVLAVGATLFTGVAALLGTRQPAALYHAAAEGVGSDPARELHALPLHQASAERATAPDETLADLKEGTFGVTFASQPIAAKATGALVPSVLVDVERPPLRLEIMGFDSVARPATAAAGTTQP